MTKRNRNIVITGFMGTGKSTIGVKVARLLKRPFIDTDELLQKQFGKPIQAIFEDEGEAAFRRAEAKLCLQLGGTTGQVISTGGGTLIPRSNLEAISKNACIFCLTASEEVIESRLKKSDKRPLTSEWKNLLDDRRQAYARIFHEVDTSHGNKDKIAELICELFSLDEQFAPPSTIVKSPDGTYPICIQQGALQKAGQLLRWIQCRSHKIIVVSNETVAKHHFFQLKHSLTSSGFDIQLILIPEGETHKNLSTVQNLYHQLLSHEITRYDTVIALGGGVTGDIVGFAAATYLRGISLVQIPTTLLSMVDSSVGGKTGVDLPEGKNLVGAFKQPRAVLIDPDLLKTLPDIEIRSGLAEIVKHALIADPQLFDQLKEFTHITEEIIRRAVQVKIDIVEADPLEKGKRALLNLGHTFGHALEKISDYEIRHGEAVAIGLVAAAQLSHSLGLCDAELPRQIESLLTQLKLPTTFGKYTKQEVHEAMLHDKKKIGAQLRLILPLAIGHVTIESAPNFNSSS